MLRIVSIAFVAAMDLSATLIVVARTDQGDVLLAADSLIGHEGGAASYGCKIIQSPRMFWAVSGVTRDSDTGYNLGAAIRELLGDRKTLSESSMRPVKAALFSMIRNEASILKREHPSFYEENMEGKQIEFVIVSRTNETVYQCDSKVTRGIPSAWDCGVAPGVHGKGAKFILGDNGVAREYVELHRETRALELIHIVFPLASQRIPQTIGGDTSILSIPVNGPAMWLEQGKCSDVLPYQR